MSFQMKKKEGTVKNYRLTAKDIGRDFRYCAPTLAPPHTLNNSPLGLLLFELIPPFKMAFDVPFLRFLWFKRERGCSKQYLPSSLPPLRLHALLLL